MEGRMFVCYSKADREFAGRIADDLRAAGVNVWIDQVNIRPGDVWDEAVENALVESSSVLIVLSPSSVGSRAVMDELSFALDEQKHIVPVLYQPCKIPLRIRRLQYIDFTGSYSSGLKTLTQQQSGVIPDAEVPAPKPQSPGRHQVGPWLRPSVLVLAIAAFLLPFGVRLLHGLGSKYLFVLIPVAVVGLAIVTFMHYRNAPGPSKQLRFQIEVMAIWLAFIAGGIVATGWSLSSSLIHHGPWYLACAILGGLALWKW